MIEVGEPLHIYITFGMIIFLAVVVTLFFASVPKNAQKNND